MVVEEWPVGRYLWILENTFISMNSHSTNISAIHKGVEYPRYPKQCLTVEFHQSGAGGRYN